MFKSNRDFADLRTEAAALQKIETKMLDELRSSEAKAQIRIWSMALFLAGSLLS